VLYEVTFEGIGLKERDFLERKRGMFEVFGSEGIVGDSEGNFIRKGESR